MNKFNLQLYSVRNSLEEDFRSTLENVAKMGYSGVEFAGYYGGYSGEELNELLEELGLCAVSAHVALDQLENNFDYHADILSRCGCEYIVCPWSDIKTEEDAIGLGKNLMALSQKCAMRGFMFAYHNHAHEFQKAENGEYLFDVVMSYAGPLVLCEFDVSWLKFADVEIETQLRDTRVYVTEGDIADTSRKVNVQEAENRY